MDLHVLHLGLLQELAGDALAEGERLLARSAGRQIELDLQLRLVVEGKHLHLHEPEGGWRHGAAEEHQHQPEERPARAGRAEQERHQPPVEARRHRLEPGRRTELGLGRLALRGGPRPARLLLRKVGLLAEEPHRRPRADDEGDGQREQHRQARTHRDRPHVGTRHAAHESHREDGGDHRERREDRRVAHFVHRFDDGAGEALARAGQVEMAVDVLDHDDGVVDEDADREDQRKEGDAIEGVAEHIGHRQGQCQRHRHGHANHHRRAPAHGQENERRHRERRDQEMLDQLIRFIARGFAVVARHRHLHRRRDQLAAQRFNLALDELRQGGGAGAEALGDGDRDRLLEAGAALLTEEHDRRLRLGPVPDLRHVLEVDGPTGPLGDQHALQLAGGEREALRLDQDALAFIHERAPARSGPAAARRRGRGPAPCRAPPRARAPPRRLACADRLREDRRHGASV